MSDTLNSNRIAFIGAGNMANSLIRGLLAKGVPAANIAACDIDAGKLAELSAECGIRAGSMSEVAALTLSQVVAWQIAFADLRDHRAGR